MQKTTIMRAMNESRSPIEKMAALLAATNCPTITLTTINNLRFSPVEKDRAIAAYSACRRPEVPPDWRELMFYDEADAFYKIPEIAAKSFAFNPPDMNALRRFSASEHDVRLLAAAFSYNSRRWHIQASFADKVAEKDPRSLLASTTARAYEKNPPPGQVVEAWLASNNPVLKLCATSAIVGGSKVSPKPALENLLRDCSSCTKETARALRKLVLPADTLKELCTSTSPSMQAIGYLACIGRDDIPYEALVEGSRNPWPEVREAAKTAAAMHKDRPKFHDFTPPARVYKKCLGGVIATALIPPSAEVYGNPESLLGAYASSAIVTNVDGKFYGEPIAIDPVTLVEYKVGQVFQTNLYLPESEDERLRGFRFYNSKIDAELLTRFQ